MLENICLFIAVVLLTITFNPLQFYNAHMCSIYSYVYILAYEFFNWRIVNWYSKYNKFKFVPTNWCKNIFPKSFSTFQIMEWRYLRDGKYSMEYDSNVCFFSSLARYSKPESYRLWTVREVSELDYAFPKIIKVFRFLQINSFKNNFLKSFSILQIMQWIYLNGYKYNTKYESECVVCFSSRGTNSKTEFGRL